MMMVKSANDMAVMLAEGLGGTVDQFAQEMTDTAHRLGMTETNYVNPNGLPDDNQITSARDLAILARALIHDFPEYSFYWHIPAIKYGRRIVRNYNPLLGRYPGADGMKTGFVCASGFNLVATAERDDKRFIAVVLGAPSSSERSVKAAELLQYGFNQGPLAWLTPSLGTLDTLTPIDAAPPDLTDEMCGRHRRRAATEEDDPDADLGNGAASGNSAETGPKFSVILSALRAPNGNNLLLDPGPVTPVVVYTGPTRSEADIAKLEAQIAAEPVPKKAKRRPVAAKPGAHKAAEHNRGAHASRCKSRRQAQRWQSHGYPMDANVRLGAGGQPAPRSQSRRSRRYGEAKRASQAQAGSRGDPAVADCGESRTWCGAIAMHRSCATFTNSAFLTVPVRQCPTIARARRAQAARERAYGAATGSGKRISGRCGRVKTVTPVAGSRGSMTVKVTIPALQQMKREGKKSVGVVAWDYQLARIADRAGFDFVSVGDSVGVNLWGRSEVLEVTLDEMLICCQAVRRGVERALVSCDMPYGPVQQGIELSARRRVPPGQGRRRRHDQGRCGGRFSRRRARIGRRRHPGFRAIRADAADGRQIRHSLQRAEFARSAGERRRGGKACRRGKASRSRRRLSSRFHQFRSGCRRRRGRRGKNSGDRRFRRRAVARRPRPARPHRHRLRREMARRQNRYLFQLRQGHARCFHRV